MGPILAPMIQLQPKLLFQTHEPQKRELVTVSQSEGFHLALTFALSEYVSQYSPTAEQLAGVRQFIAILLNLPYKEEPVPSFPVRTLDHGALAPRQPPKDK